MSDANRRTMVARIGGFARVRNIDDMDEAMQPARQGWKNKWERVVDPDGLLDPAIRTRKAKAAESEHMARMSLLSANARRKRRQADAELRAAGIDPETITDEGAKAS